MTKLVASLLLFTATTISAAENVELCKYQIAKDGEQLQLGHSLFIVGDDPEHAKTLFNYKSSFDSPVTHTYTFSTIEKGKLWLDCSYVNRGGNIHVEHVEIKTIPVSCIETMHADEPERVQSFRCQLKNPAKPKSK